MVKQPPRADCMVSCVWWSNSAGGGGAQQWRRATTGARVPFRGTRACGVVPTTTRVLWAIDPCSRASGPRLAGAPLPARPFSADFTEKTGRCRVHCWPRFFATASQRNALKWACEVSADLAAATGRSAAAKFEQAWQILSRQRVRKPRVQALVRGRALQCGMGVEAQRCVEFRLGGSAIFAIDLTVILSGGPGVCARLGSLPAREAIVSTPPIHRQAPDSGESPRSKHEPPPAPNHQYRRLQKPR